jgi:hypothetical protein
MSAVKNNGWYSTFEYMPEFGQDVLVYYNGKITVDKRIKIDSYGSHVDRFQKVPKASHWHTLPLTPKTW